MLDAAELRARCDTQPAVQRGRFLRYFTDHGYRLRDRWSVQDLDCLIPFYPERFIKEFAGFVFERR